MIDIAISQDFTGTGWKKRISGAGTINIAGGVAHCTASANESALLDYYIPVVPGMIVEMEVYAQLLAGTALVAFDAVDHNSGAWTSPDVVHLDSADWKRYHLRATVPMQASAKQFLRAVVGVPTAPSGEAKFAMPVVRTMGGYGQPIIMARGLLRVEGGAASLHPDFPSYGMSVARTAVDTVTVTLSHQLPTAPANARALVYASGTPDQAAIPLAGNVAAGAAPTFLVKWSDGAAFANISAGSWYAFLRVEV